MKIFKNCPEERKGRNHCQGCPRLKKCAYKKIKRKLKKINKSIKIATIILLLTLLYLLYFFMTTSNVGEEKEENVSSNVVTPQAIVKSVTTTEQAITKLPKKIAKKRKNKRRKIQITKKEKKLVEKVVYAEARGECVRGQVAVAAVVFNRYEFNKGKISVKDIVLSKNQFADISNITQEMLDQYPDCKRAVQKALRGYDPTRKKFKNGARYFYEPALVSEYQREIRKGVKTLKIGNHYFHNDFNE